MRLTHLFDQEYVKPTPQAGDIFELELDDNTVIETTIAGVDSEGNVELYLDETAINMIEQRGMLTEHIVKVAGGYELKSKHGNKNLGKYPTKAGAEKRERQVQYFKHMGEEGVAEGFDAYGTSTSNTNSSPELRGVNIPGDMKHPDWKEPTWSFQEVAEKLGVSPKELQQLALSLGNFPKKSEGLKSRYGSKAYYPRSEIKRWVNASDIRNIIKAKQGVAEGTGDIGSKIVDLCQKIYDLGDDAFDHVYHNASTFAKAWDKYEGDLDSIIQEVSPKALQRIYNELVPLAQEEGILEQGVAESQEDSPVANAITRRIMNSRVDLLSKYGPVKIMQAIDDVAEWVGDVDEIGSSDVSAWVRQVEQSLDSMNEAAPTALRWASGAALGTVAGAGGVIMGSMLGGVFAPIVGGIAAWNATKMGMAGADEIWDWAASKLGGGHNEQDFAMSHVRAAASGKDTFEYRGKEYPVTLPKTDVNKAVQAIKSVAESKLEEAKYHGKEVTLGKPVRGGPKKFYVYVRDPATKNIKKVNFGDPNMRIKKSSPKHRKSFRARHNCANPGPRTKARYWSCRKW